MRRKTEALRGFSLSERWTGFLKMTRVFLKVAECMKLSRSKKTNQ